MPVAQKRDLLDDLIDIQSDWQALSNPFEGMVEFFFEDITPAGRSLTNPSFARNRGDESALFGEAASFDEPAAFDEPIDVAAEDAQSDHERDAFSKHDEHAEPQPHFETETSEAYGEGESDNEAFEEAGDPTTEASIDEASGSEVAALFESPATKQAVIAGAVAGFVAGAIAAAIVCFVL